MDTGFWDNQTADFDFELALTPAAIPMLDGVGVVFLVGTMLGAGVYGSRGRQRH